MSVSGVSARNSAQRELPPQLPPRQSQTDERPKPADVRTAQQTSAPADRQHTAPTAAQGPGRSLEKAEPRPQSAAMPGASGKFAESVSGGPVSGRQAMIDSLESRGVQFSELSKDSRQAVNKAGRAIDAVNQGDVKTISDAAPIVQSTGSTLQGVNALRADNGQKLNGFAGTDGSIKVDNALKGEQLRNVVTEEVADRTFQQIAQSKPEFAKLFPQASQNGLSQGDFGQEVAARKNGASPSEIAAARQDNDATNVAGVRGEAWVGAVTAAVGGALMLGAAQSPNNPDDYPGMADTNPGYTGLDSNNGVWVTHSTRYYDGGPRDHLTDKILRKEISEDKWRELRYASNAKVRDYVLHNSQIDRPGDGWTLRKVIFQTEDRRNDGSAPDFWIKATYENYYSRERTPVSSGGGMGSDRRIKQDITELGVEPTTGLTLYSWRYRNDDPNRYVGVMAQDLLVNERTAAAVSVARTGEFAGYYQVDYAQLGLTMATEGEWKARGFDAVRQLIAA